MRASSTHPDIHIPRLTLIIDLHKEIRLKLDHFDDALCDLLKGKLNEILTALSNASAKQIVAAIVDRLRKELPDLMEVVVEDDGTSDN